MAIDFNGKAAALTANEGDFSNHDYLDHHQNDQHEYVNSDSSSWSLDWTTAHAAELYGLPRWGAGYFGISSQGNVTVNAPAGDQAMSVELLEIVKNLQQRGLRTPVLLRLENLLADRLLRLNHSFRQAIEKAGYRGKYRGVFPLKVNHQRQVVEQLIRGGQQYGYGLEVGSKAELIIAMSSVQSQDSLIICNGYKDTEFVDLALQLTRIGYQCFFVIEHPAELDRLLERGRYWNVQPLLGVRLKLSTKADGHWGNNSGDRSQFGLSIIQLIECVDRLKRADMLDRLQLLHFHLGSQIPDISNIRDGVREATRYFVDLVKEGVDLKYIDLGGGLAVDYEGSTSSNTFSCNYDQNDYSLAIVEELRESLDLAGLDHPTIITESGRWTVAPSSVLLFNVLQRDDSDPVDNLDVEPRTVPSEFVASLHVIDRQTDLDLHQDTLDQVLAETVHHRNLARDAFQIGQIDLRERAAAENISLKILKKVMEQATKLERPSKSLLDLCDSMADIYSGNFSIFQSLPDAWALQQDFPVMPIHRLNEKPTRRGIVADLTCDSDGTLDRFCENGIRQKTFPLHPLLEDQEYYLGVFLVGAYQETLGDLHNLFGDTNVAMVRIGSDGHIDFDEMTGDSIGEVLQAVDYQPDALYDQFRKRAEQAAKDGRVSSSQLQEMLQLFAAGIRGNCYPGK